MPATARLAEQLQSEITDDEWIVVRTKLGEVKNLLKHVHVEGVPKCDIEDMLEDYVTQCEKARIPTKIFANEIGRAEARTRK